jgi:Animal haem peroxidase
MHHGELYLRDQVPPRSKHFKLGKFGRLFPTLPSFAPDTTQVRGALLRLGRPGGPMDPGNDQNPDNLDIPAGFTFLGQFIDHDLTFDPTSSLDRQNDPESIENFRTPAFELDNIYASGRAASPHLYDISSGRVKFLIEKLDPNDAASQDDLPRNSQNVAIIADPRNDENVIVSQLQLAFLKFHNAVVDRVQHETLEFADVFAEAQRLVRWHYQWIVLHEFLPRIVGEEIIEDILNTDTPAGAPIPHRQGRDGQRHRGRRFYDWENKPFIPVEFAVAAYRFGHSMVRPGYRVNANFAAAIFRADLDPADPDPNDLRGAKRAPRRFVQWSHFFEIDGIPVPATINISKRIDTVLSTPLFNLPFSGPNLPDDAEVTSLAQRNLLRHLTFSLPSGQAVAKAMGIEPLDRTDLADLDEFGFARSTPLWFYILREAHIKEAGRRLGPVGGRIVAEVFIGLLQGDRQSFLRQDPNWEPTLGAEPGKFGIGDLLKVAGVPLEAE